MIQSLYGSAPHSASVELWLETEGERIELSQIGPTYVIARTAQMHPPGNMSLHAAIDGQTTLWEVHLPYGLKPDQRRTPIYPVEDEVNIDVPF